MSSRQIVSTITLPDADVLVFRKLSAKHLRKAIEAQLFAQADFIEGIKSAQDRIKAAFAGPDVVEPPKPVEPPAPTDAPVVVDPLAAYDRHTLVRLGMLSVNGETLDDAAADAWVEDLSVEDLQAAAEAVLRLTDPKAFLTDEERKAEQKNG